QAPRPAPVHTTQTAPPEPARAPQPSNGSGATTGSGTIPGIEVRKRGAITGIVPDPVVAPEPFEG
ncbi:MAG: hypothetical protein AAF612_12795, partial [Planctomycetota bacterium]